MVFPICKNLHARSNQTQIASLTKHDLVGDLLYGTVFNYFALNDLQDRIAAQSNGILNYRLPSYGIFSTSLKTQYWYGIPRNVTFGGLSMDMDHMSMLRVSKSNNNAEAIAFTQSIGSRMSAMEHLVPEQMFSTPQNQAQGISTVKALAIASQQGQKIWTINKDNITLALSKINLGTDTMIDIKNAVNAGKIVTTHEAKINFNGWVGEGYIVMEPETGSAAYMIAGGGNGSWLIFASIGLLFLALLVNPLFAVIFISAALLFAGCYLSSIYKDDRFFDVYAFTAAALIGSFVSLIAGISEIGAFLFGSVAIEIPLILSNLDDRCANGEF